MNAEDLDVPAPEASGVYLSTPSAQTTFKRAVELSGNPKPRQLRGAHVVLAVSEMERGTVARALSRLGVNREQLAAAARQELAIPAA